MRLFHEAAVFRQTMVALVERIRRCPDILRGAEVRPTIPIDPPIFDPETEPCRQQRLLRQHNAHNVPSASMAEADITEENVLLIAKPTRRLDPSRPISEACAG